MEIWKILIAIFFFLCFLVGYILGKLFEKRKWSEKIDSIKQDAIKRSRAALTGSFSEQLAPYLPDFKHSPTEVRFIGKPIDFLVFKGIDKKEPTEVVFVEVKSKKSQLSTPERKLRDIIKNKKISWELYRIPDIGD
jgi:predicted Holliday junction resolvase-like endonuclease